MAVAVCIPRLGWNMEEGTFVGWLRRDGEAVRAGEPLFSLEGEKATQDIEATDDGLLRIAPDAPKPGDRVAVGAVIGLLLGSGEGEPADRDRPRASPLARRIARERGIDWTTLRGSGRSGRIRKGDVLAAAAVDRPPEVERPRSIAVSSIRRAIAGRMVESHRATAPVTLTTTIDATNLVNLRGQFRAADPTGRDVPGYTDFIVKLTALALREHPLLNARWEGDRIEPAEAADVGIAVDTDSGLLVPVIRDAGSLGLRAIAARSRDLVARARSGTLRADEMRGGTFTVTNLGAFGVEAFTPIINLPECAILGLGRIARQPSMVGERVEGRDRMTLSLTFDHRVVDGAPAARFLRDVGRLIENPGPWLMP